MPSPHRTHDDYLATLRPDQRKALGAVRAAVRKAVPGADEVMSYGIPAFRLEGQWLLYCAAHTSHWSLACPPPTLFDRFPKDLAGRPMSKSAVRFPLDGRVPVGFLARFAKARAKEAREKAAEKEARLRSAKAAKKRTTQRRRTASPARGRRSSR